MKLSNRTSRIVSELLNNDTCITGIYLANIAGVTSRTIRDDISRLNAELKQDGVQINSISGRGYYIPADKKSKFKELVKIQNQYVMPILPKSRVEYIIKQLLLYPNGISTGAISEGLFISKSTLHRDLTEVNSILNRENISLIKKAYGQISIEGDEFKIRKIYKEYVEKLVAPNLNNVNSLNDEISIIYKSVKNELSDVLIKNGFNISGDEFNAIVILMTVVAFRVKNGFTFCNYIDKYIDEGNFSCEIIKGVFSETSLSDWEKNYISYNLHRIIGDCKKDNIPEINKSLEVALNQVKDTFNCNLSEKLEENLLSILKIDNEGYVRTDEYSLKEIKKEHPLAVEMAVCLINTINHEIELKVCDETFSKIVLMFACELEYDMLKKEQKKRDVIIICQSGKIAAELIKTKVKRHFPGLNILGVFPLYKLNFALQEEPELIISTVVIENCSVPVAVINPLFKDYDVLKIKTIIYQVEHTRSKSYEFINLFKEELFLKDIECLDKYGAIKNLSDTLSDRGYAKDNFFQAVVERENISSTAIGNMVAIPHAIGVDIGENVLAIGILKNPIDWNGSKVQLVFLINIKNAADGNVQQIFKSFFDVISSSYKVERLIKSKNYYEFIKTLNQ